MLIRQDEVHSRHYDDEMTATHITIALIMNVKDLVQWLGASYYINISTAQHSPMVTPELQPQPVLWPVIWS